MKTWFLGTDEDSLQARGTHHVSKAVDTRHEMVPLLPGAQDKGLPLVGQRDKQMIGLHSYTAS